MQFIGISPFDPDFDKIGFLNDLPYSWSKSFSQKSRFKLLYLDPIDSQVTYYSNDTQ
jgi:hypothetical protein